MKTLLIVEDEKMIRQGIATMARRCKVSIENILECRNGVEALEILENQQVDVMFTDIRMPKMDGIELVKRAAELGNCPKIVVVSGFDDFNYAVEMMKNGVRDYLLKPIKREKVEEILSRMDQELEQVQKEEAADIKILQNQFRYELLNEDITGEEWEHTGRRIAAVLMGQENLKTGFVVGLGAFDPDCEEILTRAGAFVTGDVDGQMVFVAGRTCIQKIKESLPGKMHPGFSAVHSSFSQIKDAWREAKEARMEAFVTGKQMVQWEKQDKTSGERDCGLEDLEQQFINQFATDRLKDDVRKLENLYFEMGHHPEGCEELVKMSEKLRQELNEKYGRLLEDEGENTASCQQVLYYGTSEEFIEAFREWVFQMKAELKVRFETNQNREKIQRAVEYIRKNYHKDLNMAMVSNYVSMNYSLFSVCFKEYTGVNFVNYLKDIRIQQAKKLLSQTEEKIVDISRMVGYENEKHFMKTFKAVCGVSPSEYRKGGLH